MRNVDEITGAVINCALDIHRRLGPGLLESVYELVLCRKLEQLGFIVDRQVPVSFEFDGLQFKDAFRMDILVDRRVVVELKSTERNNPVYAKQLKTYLVLSGMNVGLLINFGMATLKEGLQRVVNGLDQKLSILAVNRHQDSTSSNLRDSASPREEDRHKE